MKYAILVVLSISFHSANAQCINNDLGQFSINAHALIKKMDISDSGVYVVMKPRIVAVNNSNTREVVVTKSSLDGTVNWHCRVNPLNADFNLEPLGIRGTPDGGAIIFGQLEHSTYENQFAVKISGSGSIEWGRIYMLHDNSGYGPDRGNRGIKQLPNGQYSWVLRNAQRFYHVLLNPNGTPANVLAVNDPNYSIISVGRCHLQDDGSLLLAFLGIDSLQTGSLSCSKIDATGNINWAVRMPMSSAYPQPTNINIASNGDYLVAVTAPRRLLRISNTGSIVWAKSMAGQTQDIFELDNGDIMQFKLYPYGISKLNPQGTTIEQWSLPYQALGDIIATHDNSFGAWLPYGGHFMLSADPSHLGASCNVQTDALETLTPYTQFTIPNTTINTSVDSLKTWTMALASNSDAFLDVRANLAGSAVRPGFQANYYASVENTSFAPSGAIEAKFVLPPELTFDAANPSPTQITGDTLIWDSLPALDIYEKHEFQISASVPADTSLIGIFVNSSFQANQDSIESSLVNNATTLLQEVTASYDPNDKLVSPQNVFDPFSDSLLNYTIRFQNTGTDTAFTVVLVDTLPEEVSVSTFQVGAASHPFAYELTPQGILTFTFNNILLPDSNVNEAESHGLINFSIRPDQNLNIGTEISNSADIYFDFNPPVRTPAASVLYGLVTNVSSQMYEGDLRLFPVPVRDQLNIRLPDNFRAVNMTLSSLDGKIIQSHAMDVISQNLSLNVRNLLQGHYVLTFRNEAGYTSSAKFLKE